MNGLVPRFAHPALWPFLLAAFLPIVLHLLERSRAPVVEWPAIRFLLDRDRRVVRRSRRRERWLIALRVAAVLLLVLTAMDPRSGPASAPLESSSARRPPERGVVLLIDTSRSTRLATAAGGPSVEKRLRRLAHAWIETLGPRDRALLLDATLPAGAGPVDPLEREPAHRALDALAPSGRPLHLLFALARGLEAARELPALAPEVVLFTDLLGETVRGVPEGAWRLIGQRRAAQSPPPRITIVDGGVPERARHAVRSLRAEDLLAGVDQPLRLEAEVSFFSTREPVRLQLRIDGEPRSEAVARPAETATDPAVATVEFEPRLTEPGAHRLAVVAKGEDLPLVPQRALVIDVADRLDVLLVTAAGSPEETSESPLYRALWPRPPLGSPPPTILRPRSLRRLPDLDSAGRRVVILADGVLPPEDSRDRLEAAVARGQGLIVFLGPAVTPERAEFLARSAGGGLLPVRPIRRGEPTGDAPAHPVDIDTSHPALTIFADPRHGNLADVSVRRWWEVSPPPEDVAVLARLEGGAPWIVAARHRRGRVVLLTTSARPDDTDLPWTPLFVPLVDRLVRWAAGGSAAPERRTGSAIEAVLEDAAEGVPVEIFSPEGERFPAERARAGGGARVTGPVATTPGFWTLRASGRDGRRVERPIAVNAPEEESDPRRIGEALRHRIEREVGLRIAREAPAAPRSRAPPREARSWWLLLAALALAALLGETALARRPVVTTRGAAP